jgi:hypothetical protein
VGAFFRGAERENNIIFGRSSSSRGCGKCGKGKKSAPMLGILLNFLHICHPGFLLTKNRRKIAQNLNKLRTFNPPKVFNISTNNCGKLF